MKKGTSSAAPNTTARKRGLYSRFPITSATTSATPATSPTLILIIISAPTAPPATIIMFRVGRME